MNHDWNMNWYAQEQRCRIGQEVKECRRSDFTSGSGSIKEMNPGLHSQNKAGQNHRSKKHFRTFSSP